MDNRNDIREFLRLPVRWRAQTACELGCPSPPEPAARNGHAGIRRPPRGKPDADARPL